MGISIGATYGSDKKLSCPQPLANQWIISALESAVCTHSRKYSVNTGNLSIERSRGEHKTCLRCERVENPGKINGTRLKFGISTTEGVLWGWNWETHKLEQLRFPTDPN